MPHITSAAEVLILWCILGEALFMRPAVMRRFKTSSDILEVITEVYISLMLLVFPLWMGMNGYIDTTGTKYSFFEYSTIVYLAVMMIVSLEMMIIGKYHEVSERLRHFGTVQVLVALYAAFCCISALLSDYGFAVWIGLGQYEGLRSIILYVAIFLCVSFFGRFKRYYIYIFSTVVIVNAIIGFLQYSGLNPFFLFPEGYTYHDAFILYSGQFMGTFGNADVLSAYLSIAVPIIYAGYIIFDKHELLLVPLFLGVLLLLINGASAGIVGACAGIFISLPIAADSRIRFAKAWICLGVMLISLSVFTSISVIYEEGLTRVQFYPGAISLFTAISGAVVMVGGAVFIRRDHMRPWESGKVRKLLLIFIIFSALLTVIVIWAYPFPSGLLQEAHQILHGNLDESFGSSRFRIWAEVLRLIPEHFWFGGGPDTLAERMTFSFQRYSETLGKTIETNVDAAHNDYLNIFVNTGIFSLLAYLLALTVTIIKSSKICLRDKLIYPCLASFLSYLIQIFFAFSICMVSPLFWIVFGMLVNPLSTKRERL